MDTITICMGSSCFGLGNASNTENVEDSVTTSGCLCGDACARAPNININDKHITGVSEPIVTDIIVKELGLRL